MLDIKAIRENPDYLRHGARRKRMNFDVDRLLAVDQQLRHFQSDWEEKQAERNRISKTIGKAPAEQREELKAQVHSIKAQMEVSEARLVDLKQEFEAMMLLAPNPPRDDVPDGRDDNDNVEVRREGQPPDFSFAPRDHTELGKMHGFLDFERGVKLAGSRSYVLRGELAQLEAAVMRYTVQKLINKGYEMMSIPVLVKEDCMIGTGYFPTGKDQAYYVEKDQLALVGTAEVSLTSFFSGEIVPLQDLPFRCFAHSSCFRREAGTYGKDTHGLYRVHQFQKVEQVIIAPPDAALSEKLHDELVANAEELLRDFGLAYRVVYVCTGDLGQGQLRKHDIETWMPSRNAYSETHSCSTFHDFQARRLNLRTRDDSGKPQFCYTLNNTAIASPRVLIPLIENHQQADGTIRIPACLQPLMNGKTAIGKPQ